MTNGILSHDSGHYTFGLIVQIETCIDEYEQDMRNWYERTAPTDREVAAVDFEQAKRVFDHLLQVIEELHGETTPDAPLVSPELEEFLSDLEKQIRELVQIIEEKGLSSKPYISAIRNVYSDGVPEQPNLKIVWELLLVHSIRKAVARAEKAPTRILMFANLSLPQHLSERSRRFLRQAADCFVWGFHAPCVVFCRSVIDVALEDAGHRQGNLCSRVNRAFSTGLLDDDGKQHAHAIRKLGNNAVHDLPLTMNDVVDVIRRTLTVLQQISKAAG